ncbi:hypothetical protein MRX96_026814 [Rhipicephalus microplus]
MLYGDADHGKFVDDMDGAVSATDETTVAKFSENDTTKFEKTERNEGGKPVSMDARPVLLPIISLVVCFPIVAFAVICALRYGAQRLRRKERLARLCGASTRVGRLDGLGRLGERPSFFSHDSSSGEASCWRPPESGGDSRRLSKPGASSSSSSGGYHFVDEITAVRDPGRKKSLSASSGTEGSRRGSRVTFGAAAIAATVLQVPVVSESRPGSP